MYEVIFMKLIKSIATVGTYTALSRFFGFVRDMLIASILGAGPIADAFFVSFKFPNLFRRLFAEGAFNAAFVPTFASLYASRSLREALNVAEQVFSFMLFSLIFLVIIIEANLDWLMTFIAPGFIKTPERLYYAIEFTRITFPYLLLISLTSLLSGILNSLHHFAAAAAAPIILNICMIFALLFFATTFETPGHALAWGIFGAGLIQFGWLYWVAYRSNAHIKLLFPRLTPPVMSMLKLMLPGMVGAGVMQINIFMDMMIASFLPAGSVSYLFYADRLNQLPLSLTGVAISTVLLPVLAKQFKTNQREEALNTQSKCLEFGLFFVLPATVALILIAHPLVEVLFGRGKFGPLQVHETALTVIAYVCGLPAYVLVKVFSTNLFARHDTKTPVITATVSMAINLALNLLLMSPFQHVGLAAATAVAAWANAFMLGAYLIKYNLLKFDQRLKEFLPRLFLACLMMGIVLFGLNISLQEGLGGIHKGHKIIGIFLLIGAGLFIFILFSFLFRVIKRNEIKEFLRKANKTNPSKAIL